MNSLKIRFFISPVIFILAILSGCNSKVDVALDTKNGTSNSDEGNSEDIEEASQVYTISSIKTTIKEHDTFGFSFEADGEDGSVKAYYCNTSDTPACDPVNDGIEIDLLQDGIKFVALPPELDINDDPADILKIEIVAENLDLVKTTETFTYTIPSIVKIFRSVGPGSATSLQNSSGSEMAIVKSVASFDTPLSNSIGIGDIIQYDSTNDGTVDSVIAIHGRINSQNYLVKNIDGSSVSDLVIPDLDWGIFRAYTSLRNAEMGFENTGLEDALENFESWSNGRDLVTNNEQWNITCYADADDTGGELEIIGWTTDDDHYLHIYTPVFEDEVGESQRHTGLLNGPGFVFRDWIRFHDNKTIVEGLIVKYAGTRGLAVVFRTGTNPAKAYFIGNIVYTYTDNTYWGPIGTFPSGGQDQEFYIVNNILIPAQPTTVLAGIYITDSSGPQTFKVFAYNNTIFCPLNNGASGILVDTGTLYAKNNLVDCSISSGSDFSESGGGGSIIDSINNMSTDGTSDDYGSANNSGNIINASYTFLDSGNFNFEQSNLDTSGKGLGLDLSTDGDFSFAKDIIGNDRNDWDIGAYAY